MKRQGVPLRNGEVLIKRHTLEVDMAHSPWHDRGYCSFSHVRHHGLWGWIRCRLLPQYHLIKTDAVRVRRMIYFLSQPVPRDYPRLNLKKGAPMCKVLADSLNELMCWGNRHGLTRIHISRNGKPHYDLWGSSLVLCPHFEEMKRHRNIYRTNFMKT